MGKKKKLVSATDYIKIEGWMWEYVDSGPYGVVIYAYVYGWTVYRGYAWERKDYLCELLGLDDCGIDLWIDGLVCSGLISRKKIESIGEVWVAEIPFERRSDER